MKKPAKRHAAKRRAAAKAQLPPAAPPPWIKVSDFAIERSHIRRQAPRPFVLPQPPPGVLPKNAPTMAKDQTILNVNAWANEAVYAGAFWEGQAWLGFTYLSELAQRPEYRRLSEVLATEATRKWIKFQSTHTGRKKPGIKIGGREYGGVAFTDEELAQQQAGKRQQDAAGAKEERIKDLTEEFKRLNAKGAFAKMSVLDGFFGRGHLYIDTGDTDDRPELVTPIGDGTTAATDAKFKGKKNFLQALRPVEPIWCYPADYNANDPLRPDWYNPQTWFCQGKKIHSTRLLTFIAREVPDLLKPSYMFGGLSMSQMMKPYVDNWLRGRQAISDLVWSFSVSGLETDLSVLTQQDGDQLFKRAELFNNLRNNRGLMLLQKEQEKFFNITTPLSTLDALQAQLQEHLCSVSGTPVVKLLGIQPSGLNASSEGELECWYDWVEAYQEHFFTLKLTTVMHLAMRSLWGEVDPEITFAYESLRSDDPVQEAQRQKILAETDDILIASGSIWPEESRQRLADDPDSGYDGIDVEDLPEPPEGPESIDIRGNERPSAIREKESEPGDQQEAA